MPRDLAQEQEKPTLTESPNSVSDRPDSPSDSENPSSSFVMVPQNQKSKKKNATTHLVPYTRPLTIHDLDSVVALENVAFTNPDERATKEKLAYRLSKCGNLCLGLFCTIVPGSGEEATTLATGRPVETSRKDGAICVLIGHVIAAKTNASTVTDESMDYPADWATNKPATTIGHQEDGRTICLHSVAILPEYQGRGLGRVLLLAYMQQMNGAGIADRLALIAHDHLAPYYERYGFHNQGPSKATFGGGNWIDMSCQLKPLEARATYG